MLDQRILLIASFIANAMSAFAGGGAGLVQFPVLIFMGLPFATALATHKIATVALGIGATLRNVKNASEIDYKFALLILISGVLGTILGAYIIIQVPDKIAQTTLGLITVGLGVYTFFKKGIGETETLKNRTKAGYVIGCIVLFLLGVFNGSITSGSGLFVTIWLILWFGLDYKKAVMYTMTLVGFFWNLSGALAITAFGSPIHWPWIPVLLIGSIAGGYAGAHLGHLKGNTWIKYGFTFVTLLSGIALLLK